MDCSPIATKSSALSKSFSFSAEALYEVLEGKDLVLGSSDCAVILHPDEEELVISCEEGESNQEIRVWIAEIALGWNMLAWHQGQAQAGL